MPSWQLEYQYQELHSTGLIAGVDEVGRGCLAGAVVAAAVVFPAPQAVPDSLLALIDDSKKISVRQRQIVCAALPEYARISIAEASVAEIDQINILQASLLAMRRAVAGLACAPHRLLVDGNQLPRSGIPETLVIKGDSRSYSIAAASIVAKHYRDQMMARLAEQYPGYGWERNAGYPSPMHRAALQHLGVTPHHRRSFAPVRAVLAVDPIPA